MGDLEQALNDPRWVADDTSQRNGNSPLEALDHAGLCVVPRALLDRVAGLLARLEWAGDGSNGDPDYCPACSRSVFHADCELAEVRAALEKVCKGCAKPGDPLQPTENRPKK